MNGLFGLGQSPRDPRKVRQPAVAGAFYPADPQALTETIEVLLAKTTPQPVGQIVAAMAPHAGYVYSGSVAASAFAAMQGSSFARVVVIAPTHTVAFQFSSVYDGDAYATPLGLVPIDTEFAHRLAHIDSGVKLSALGHQPADRAAEHAVEVQLPWLQHVLGNFQLVPIVMGRQDYDSSRALGVALARLIAAESGTGPTLVLASSDLSHYHSSREAHALDASILQAITDWDYFSLSRNLNAQVWEACGGAAIVAAMIYAERMGANCAKVLEHGDSSNVSGDFARVVGYAAAVFARSDAQQSAAGFSLPADQKAELMAIARRSVESIVAVRELYDPPPPSAPELNRDAGAFVTLTRGGVLRGCVGFASAVKPLYLSVRDAATLAAMRDSRFAPVAPEELPGIAFEISVLSPLRRVSNIHQIQLGRDGLLIKNGAHQGLLLPQVPVEHQWNLQQFLEQTCIKAGLPSHAWSDESTDIFRFSAVVFN